MLCVFTVIVLIFSLCMWDAPKAQAAAPDGIRGNGTGGISININAPPYTDFAGIQTWGQYAYGESGCAWFASARVRELTGKGDMIYSGYSWYNSAYSNYGFSRGNSIRAKALACYSGHVAVVESVSGDTAVISEGGSTYYSSSSNGYCVIRTMSVSDIESSRFSGTFLGYVYLGEGQPPSELTYSNLHTEFVDTNNVGLYGYIDNPGRASVTEVGAWLWDSSGNQVVEHKEGCGLSSSFVEQRLDVVKEAKPDGLRQGETYTYQLYAIANGNVYKSPVEKFTINDDQKPVISNIEVSSVNETGYTVSCTVTDNYKVDKVQFPSWTDANGKDDLIEGDLANGILSGDKFTYSVKISDHSNEKGLYHTQINAYDLAGNCSTEEVMVTIKEETEVSKGFSRLTVSDITEKSAVIKAEMPRQYVESWWVLYGDNKDNMISTSKESLKMETSVFIFNYGTDANPLKPRHTYYAQFCFINSSGVTVKSDIQSFTTKEAQPIQPGTPDIGDEDDKEVVKLDRVSIYSVSSHGRGKMRASWWALSDADGYQIAYSTSKSFNRWNTVTKNISSNLTTEKTIKGLSRGRTYYVRVRAYVNTDSGRVYGKWSSKKKVKIRR